jgi:uncharacterized protein YegP (UPF0339 family)
MCCVENTSSGHRCTRHPWQTICAAENPAYRPPHRTQPHPRLLEPCQAGRARFRESEDEPGGGREGRVVGRHQLITRNGEPVGRSEICSSNSARNNGIASVQTDGPAARVDDLTD